MAGIMMDSMEKNQQLKWYALSVYARQEKAAHAEIAGLGLETFLPTSPVRRLWSDRVKQLEQPLFPGYLFVRLELTAETRIRLIRLHQVIDLVGKNWGYASSVPDIQIESLRLLLASEKILEPTLKLISGTEVMISQGPLRGTSGIVEREASGQRRIIVQVPLLGRGVRTVLSVDDVLSYEELGLTNGDRQGVPL
jgi:transcription antitermination factor NusG